LTDRKTTAIFPADNRDVVQSISPSDEVECVRNRKRFDTGTQRDPCPNEIDLIADIELLICNASFEAH
jgi:hypothetical protein